MPPGKRGKNVVASGSEGIDALPDGVLEHILGFLPAEEAVQTCVLARRWRHLWKSATGLRVRCVVDGGDDPASLEEYLGIVDRILHLRGRASLQTFEVVFRKFYDPEHMARLNRWIQHAIMCQVRTLKILWHQIGRLADQPLVSRYLTRLEVVGVYSQSDFSDLSGCPSLEHLDIIDCYFFTGAGNIASESLKRLTIRNCIWDSITLVCVPNLVSLQLDGHFLVAPVFQSMPLLQEAFVRITNQGGHNHSDSNDYCEYEYCCTCYGINIRDETSECGLLKHLSEVENLALISGPKTFIFNSGLKQCPTFSKLKSLLLNDCWCVAPDFHALSCILKHSPVLQKLCLQLFSKGPKHKLGVKGRRNTTELSAAISGNLKIVEVNCEVTDERVFKVLRFLGTLGISFSLDEVEIFE